MINKSTLMGIYPICQDYICSDIIYLTKIEEVISSGIKVLQLRYKNVSARKKRYLLITIHRLCIDNNVLLIINDDYHAIKYIDGCGLHLGNNDISISRARKIFGSDIVIGKSCYGSIEDAKTEEKNGASYISFGAMYKSQTKKNALTFNHEIITEAKKVINIPICVIGGINKSNLMHVIEYKPDMISMVSGIFKYDNPGREIKKMMELMLK